MQRFACSAALSLLLAAPAIAQQPASAAPTRADVLHGEYGRYRANNDQWRDEVERVRLSVAIPSSLVDVSNGKFSGKTDLGDGYTRWDWNVQYPIFDQYLRHTALPALELSFDDRRGTVSYRWKADERAFAMPIRVGSKDRWQVITPTTAWQTMPTSLKADAFEVATDLYYVTVSKS